LSPTEAVIIAYENTTKPILHRIQENHRQAQTLATLRDTLLPRLISGQLHLPQAEPEMNEVFA
jgi:type I restriction enzyme S subunit